jgi:tetratricopeptide (TPR) repeat protein
MNQPGFMEQLLALAPRRYLIVVAYVGHRYRAKPKPEDLKAAYGQLLEYDGRALGKLAELVKDQPEEHRQVLVRLCDLNADNCLGLAEHLLLDREMGEAAAVAFERARQHARNRVGVANSAEWFMHYYFDLGQVEKARAVAEEAEAVGSAAGMATMGRLQERMGKYPEAESYYRQIAQRYQNTLELDAFYVRREVKAKDGRYRALAAEALKRMFPEGLQRVSISDFTAPPDNTAQAILIAGRDLTEKWRRYGIKAGDRVFALDGYRVGNWDQYRAVRSLSDDPQMSTIVWRDGRYLEVTGTFKRRRFGP